MRTKRKAMAVTGTTRTSVEVLLAESVDTLGKQGDVVRVKPGFARNYLLPQGLATIATEHNKQMVVRHQQRLAELRADQVKGLKSLADTLSDYSVTLEANANADGHLYGSIGPEDISKAIIAAGYQVKPSHLKLEGPLRELGMYTIKVELDANVKCDLKVWVVPAAAE